MMRNSATASADEHIDEEAELYAIGLLAPAPRDRSDAHAAICDLCARRLGNASRAIANIVDASQRRAERRPRWPLAVAAAFAVTSAVTVQQNLALHGALGDDGRLLDTMVTSHFAHRQFTGPAGEEIDAKAIYDHHGAWFEILAAGEPEWNVILVAPDGSHTRVARFVKRGKASMAFFRAAHGVASIELQDAAGSTVGTVNPEIPLETR
jgi:hypothetical protein